MKKLFLILFAILFLPNFASAAELTLPLSVSIASDIPESPVTYNGVTYNDYIYSIAETWLSGWYVVNVIYFNLEPDGYLTTYTDQYNDVYIEGSGVDDINGVLFASNMSQTLPADIGSVDFAIVEDPQDSVLLNIENNSQNKDTLFWGSSSDVYDSTGTTVLYQGTNPEVIEITGEYDPFSGNLNLNIPGFENGVAIVPYSPQPNYFFGSDIPIFRFDETDSVGVVSLDLIFGTKPTYDTRRFVLTKLGNPATEIEDDTFPIVPGAYVMGFNANQSRLYLSLPFTETTAAGDQYRVEYLDDTGVVLTDLLFQVENPVYIVGSTNVEKVTGFCDTVPHDMAGSLIGFAYDFDFHTDDFCKLIVPPDNYFRDEFSGIYKFAMSKFGFIGQTTALLSTAQTAFASTPAAPTMPTISVMGHTWNTFDFSTQAAGFDFLRRLTAAAMWILTAIVAFVELKSYFRGSGEEELI